MPPEVKEMAKQHTLKRARLNSELQELNKILERKEKIATQFSMNDNKMAELREQYEVRRIDTDLWDTGCLILRSELMMDVLL